jgi:hypothetical protein
MRLATMQISARVLFCLLFAFSPVKSCESDEARHKDCDLADVDAIKAVDFAFPVPVEACGISVSTEPMDDARDSGWNYEHPYAEMAAYALVGLIVVGIVGGVCAAVFMGHYKLQQDPDYAVYNDPLP